MGNKKLDKYPCNSIGSVDNSEIKFVLCHAITYYLQHICKNKETIKDSGGDIAGVVPCEKCVQFGHHIIKLLTNGGDKDDKRNNDSNRT